MFCYEAFTCTELELSQWCGPSDCDSWIFIGAVVGMRAVPGHPIGRPKGD